MERNLRLIEIYSNRFREAKELISVQLAQPESNELSGLLENFSSKWETLYNLYETVIRESEVNDLEARVNTMEEFRSQYIRTRASAQATKNTIANRQLPANPSAETSTQQALSTVVAKLTASRIPSFSGGTLKWPKREIPSSVIEGLPLTSNNYAVVVELLQKHFGSTDVIIQENFRQLHNLAAVPPGNHAALKQFLMKNEVRVRSLETLGVPYDRYAFPFVSLLVDRLPRDIRIAWYRSTADKETRPDVKDVLAFLRKEVISQHRGRNLELFSRKWGAEEGASYPRELRKVRFTPSAAALTTVSKIGSKQDRRNECMFCHLAHTPLKCVLPLENRLETVKREKRCFAWLRSGHRAAECRNPNPNCRKCQRRHHTALCRSKEEDPNHEKDHKEEKIKPSTSTIKLCTSLSQQVEICLKTATVFLYGPLGTSKATCLVDEGSQRSYVTER
ncbi:hypothetical protein GHT06_008763 [Daphnia sinensis]|uniref:Peptidase aspartic putative domain-containing protein n=1 Tax=Daphnia sinensis TaxID=1820382 RepID=A0AAD5PYS0_9CRUS|nr:hypothetical protein GHT06_008763 [Daphnia sinensis]